MTLLFGGGVAAVLGLIGLIAWWSNFIELIKGGLPLVMLLGGILAMYIGFDNLQEKLNEERQRQDERLEKAKEEMETAKAQADQYKEELEKLKAESGKGQ
ncbi:MAG: hypothetical protein JXA41_05725 [Deltaproteobacteria bacterium]|nr:hypothetical protein [Deltaproteobacteria bacterium]